jgi:predicted nuclease with TOPRIM domain
MSVAQKVVEDGLTSNDPKKEDVEEAATRLQNEAARLEKEIQQISNDISDLETNYDIETSVARKVARTVLKRKGRFLENVGSIGSACGSIAPDNLFALIGLGTGIWNLGKTFREIYKEVKTWRDERREPKATRRTALSEWNKRKEQLEKVRDQLEKLQSSSSSSSSNLQP